MLSFIATTITRYINPRNTLSIKNANDVHVSALWKNIKHLFHHDKINDAQRLVYDLCYPNDNDASFKKAMKCFLKLRRMAHNECKKQFVYRKDTDGSKKICELIDNKGHPLIAIAKGTNDSDSLYQYTMAGKESTFL